MALITRVSRLLRADIHAVLDRVEEPDVLLRQAVREMEEELAGEEQRYRALTLERDQLAARQRDLERSLRQADEELDVCFESRKEDLARALIRRKLEAQRMQQVLSQKAQELEGVLTRLDTRLGDHRSRLEALRQKVELLSEEDAFRHTGEAWNLPDVTVREEDVEVAFLREKKRRAGS